MMPSFALGRSNNTGLVEDERTENSPCAFQDGPLMAKKRNVQSCILEGSIAKMYDCISFFMTILISLFPIGEEAGNHPR